MEKNLADGMHQRTINTQAAIIQSLTARLATIATMAENGEHGIANLAREAAGAAASAKPVAWMTEDGRVSVARTKAVMAKPSQAAFNIPLFAAPVAQPLAPSGAVPDGPSYVCQVLPHQDRIILDGSYVHLDYLRKVLAAQPLAGQDVQAVTAKYRYVTFNGPALKAEGMNLKFNEDGTLTAWPVADLNVVAPSKQEPAARFGNWNLDTKIGTSYGQYKTGLKPNNHGLPAGIKNGHWLMNVCAGFKSESEMLAALKACKEILAPPAQPLAGQVAAPAVAQPDRSDAPAGVAVTERDGWNAAAKAIAERAAGHYKAGNYELQDECLQCASMLHDLKPAAPSQQPTDSAAPSGDDLPISMSTYGTKEACEAEHRRRAAPSGDEVVK